MISAEGEEIGDEEAQSPIFLRETFDCGQYEVQGQATGAGTTLAPTVNQFLETLLEKSCTRMTRSSTVTGLAGFVGRFSNDLLLSEITTKDTATSLSLPVKALIISIWLIVCLKVHNGRAPTVQDPAWRQCATLKGIAIAIASDSDEIITRHVLPSSDKITSHDVLLNLIRYWTARMEAFKPREWSDIPWWRDIPGGELFARYSVCLKEATFLNVLNRGGLCGFTEFVLKKELESGQSPLRHIWDHDDEWVMAKALLMFASMSPPLLEACIRGDVIALREQAGHPVQEELAVINAREDSAPGTYGNYFTDRSGMAPSPIHLMPIVKDLNRYIKKRPTEADNKWAATIDKTWCPKMDWSDDLNLQGLRRYTDWRPNYKKKPLEPCRPRKVIIQAFSKELEKQLRKSEYGLLPCPRAIVNIGFSVRPHHRLSKSHAKHNQSNYIMNLFHALLVHHYGDEFLLQQTTLYTCWRASECWLSEILLTRIAQGYTTNGMGFSHYQAGLSNYGAYRKLSLEDWLLLRQGMDMGRVTNALKEDSEKKVIKVEDWEKLTAKTMLDAVNLTLELLRRQGIVIEDYE